ncbi:MAG: glycosyltransferase family 4 protein, partial [Acidobacteriaceae bacterium]|nr:glycosyltransferase family 4 protein [Acidobacteriaceae bacterium]
MASRNQSITIFTPSFADESNTNAQNLTVKEIVARLPPDMFRVIMLSAGNCDPRIAARKSTVLLPYFPHGNSAHLLVRSLLLSPEIYFYPRVGPLDRAWFAAQKHLTRKTCFVTHVVSLPSEINQSDALVRSILQAKVVFANSRFLAQTIRQRFGIDAGTIYNGVDRRFFFPGPRRENRTPLRVLYAGSLQAHKRPEVVVRQAARFPNISFGLVGQGNREVACRQLAGELRCNNVEFLGHLTLAQLGQQMRQADVFLFPSIDEGHPQVLGQAAACGLPAIAMNSYRPEYVVHGRTGFLVDSDDELTSKLALLIHNSDLRHGMGDAAIEHSKRFDWDRIAEQWINV